MQGRVADSQIRRWALKFLPFVVSVIYDIMHSYPADLFHNGSVITFTVVQYRMVHQNVCKNRTVWNTMRG